MKRVSKNIRTAYPATARDEADAILRGMELLKNGIAVRYGLQDREKQHGAENHRTSVGPDYWTSILISHFTHWLPSSWGKTARRGKPWSAGNAFPSHS